MTDVQADNAGASGPPAPAPGDVTVTRLDGFRMRVAGSEAVLEVDVPVGEGGEGAAFRSVELLLGALGTCMAGTMLGFAANQGIPVGEVDLRLRPVLADRPHRVERVEVDMRIGGAVTERQLASLRRVAQHCKIHATLEQIARVELAIDAPAVLPGG